MEPLFEPPASRLAAEQKALAAERAIAWLRCAVVAMNTGLYLLMDGPGVHPGLAWTLIALSALYGLAVVVLLGRPRYRVLRESHLTAFGDLGLALAWIYATGAGASPFYPVLYGIAVANAFRFGAVESTLLAIVSAAAYLAVGSLGPAAVSRIEWASRLLYIPIVSALATLWARETLAQTKARIELERMARDLRRAEQRLRELLDAAPEAVLLVDQGGIVRQANQEASALLGAESEALLGRRAADLLPGIEAHLPGPSSFDLELPRPEGDPVPLHLRLRRLALEDGSATIVAAHDETHRRMAEALRSRFVEQVITASEEERRRLARELHDEAGQTLVSLVVGLKSIEAASSLDEATCRARRLASLAERTAEEMGRIARGLHPVALEAFGLRAALEQLAWDVTQIHEVEVDLHVSGLPEGQRLPPRVETALYRCVQEALTNVVKHAQASTVSVVVERRETSLTVLIEDDGVGFDEAAVGKAASRGRGAGLQGIRERLGLVGGELTLESAPGEGTTLRLAVPLAPTDSPDRMGDEP
ncbi:MAG: PAS domain-containing protein [Deltaproteobacteria bacterium]|nr:MAG: PAS domain-containing protein [Deltaproteobacteria bacterium]